MATETNLPGELQAELLGAALRELDEAIAVLDCESRVVFCNPAAEAITGYHYADLLGRQFSPDFYQVEGKRQTVSDLRAVPRPLLRIERRSRQRNDLAAGRPLLVTLRHALGHSLPGMLRITQLRDETGSRFGTLLRFHPVEEIDTLPHGEMADEGGISGMDGFDARLEQSQAGMEDRLDEAWQEWKTNAVPFGLLWVNVDQAAVLRRTHGRDAVEAMLEIVERTLLHGMRPTEMLARWGTHEFLVICHERTTEMLRAHGRHLAASVRTAEFRWWGDQIPLTASVGAAQAGEAQPGLTQAETLSALLRRAQLAMGAGAPAAAISISQGKG